MLVVEYFRLAEKAARGDEEGECDATMKVAQECGASESESAERCERETSGWGVWGAHRRK